MKKVICVLLLLVFIFPLVASAPPIKTINTISPTSLTLTPSIPSSVAQNQSHIWYVHIINSSQQFLTGVTCVFHIYNESTNGAHVYENISNTISSDGDLKFTTYPSNLSSKGEYSFKWICNSSVQSGVYEETFYVTKNGFYPADDLFKMFIWFLFILTSVGLFYTFFLTIAKIATADESVADVLVAWSFLILTMVVVYLSENYLLSSFVENLANSWLTILIWSNGVLPLIAFIISVFYKSTQKRNVLDVGTLWGGNR